MSDLIDTTEMYLRTIFELEEDGITPLRARIAERLQQSGPTVSQTVARMERDGLVVVTRDRHLELTPEGRARATRVMRKHRLAERLLIDVIGLEWEYLHEEACRWEHVMSERVEHHLLRLLDNPTESPFGNPIPGLEELGVPPDLPTPADSRTVALADVPASDGPVTMLVRRLGEPVQGEPDAMARLDALGIRPGRLVRVQRAGRSVQVAPPDGDSWTSLPDAIAGHLFVRPAGSGASTTSPGAAGATAAVP